MLGHTSGEHERRTANVFEKGAQGGQPLCPLFPFPECFPTRGRAASQQQIPALRLA